MIYTATIQETQQFRCRTPGLAFQHTSIRLQLSGILARQGYNPKAIPTANRFTSPKMANLRPFRLPPGPCTTARHRRFIQEVRSMPRRKCTVLTESFPALLPQVQPQMSLGKLTSGSEVLAGNAERPKGQYLNTPPNQTTETSSSPPTFPPSSPSLALTQRRNIPNLREAGQHVTQDSSIPPFPTFDHNKRQPQPKRLALSHAPPIVQGIRLVSPNELSDRFRSVFPFQLFNAVQSKCYSSIFDSNDNVVVSAPTGSGKTVILEMAICKLLLGFKTDQYKIIYMAPTKSLCSERQRDWQAKFASLDLQCAELTGDTDNAQLRHVQNSSIIITTPEKWDSMTRKWKDQARLMQLVKLFL